MVLEKVAMSELNTRKPRQNILFSSIFINLLTNMKIFKKMMEWGFEEEKIWEALK